ncbi:hypothetical protein [uncultured Roseobacter sp.]|uniref:hypothetical protein n=1 Tax=uncultured Roseobacter sp. TaxID=114847 RepID=UPI002630DADB|nr:hypothetical protein [uncultured Roseobacter sp.]
MDRLSIFNRWLYVPRVQSKAKVCKAHGSSLLRKRSENTLCPADCEFDHLKTFHMQRMAAMRALPRHLRVPDKGRKGPVDPFGPNLSMTEDFKNLNPYIGISGQNRSTGIETSGREGRYDWSEHQRTVEGRLQYSSLFR